MTVGELKKALDEFGDQVDVCLSFDGDLCEISEVEWSDNTGEVVIYS